MLKKIVSTCSPNNNIVPWRSSLLTAYVSMHDLYGAIRAAKSTE